MHPLWSSEGSKQTDMGRVGVCLYNLVYRGVKDVCEKPSQLVNTFQSFPSCYVVVALCFLSVKSPQGSLDISCVQTKWLFIRARHRFPHRSGVECPKPAKVVTSFLRKLIFSQGEE